MGHVSLGKFVCLEGIDGSGKTLVAQQMTERLKQEGVNALFAPRSLLPAEPLIAERMRTVAGLLWDYAPKENVQALGDRHLILLMASWFDLFHKFVIEPALHHHQIVITDQGVNKYIARFHAKGQWYVKGLFDHLRRPHCVLLLTSEPSHAATRKLSYRLTECNSAISGSPADFVSFQARVAERLSSLRDKTWVNIDSNGPAENVVQLALDCVRSLVIKRSGHDTRSSYQQQMHATTIS